MNGAGDAQQFFIRDSDSLEGSAQELDGDDFYAQDKIQSLFHGFPGLYVQPLLELHLFFFFKGFYFVLGYSQLTTL